MELAIHTDGGSRGNPGKAACACVFLHSDGTVLHENGRYLGVMTNNEAEYEGFLLALQTWFAWPAREKIERVVFRLDSQLVVEQVLGHWKIKEPRLQVYVEKVRAGLRDLTIPFSIEAVRRERNRDADRLVNQVLDQQEQI